MKTTVSLKVSEALNEFKNTGDERKTINKLIKRAPEVFLYINLALVFDHIESTGWNVSLYYSLLENLFNFIPREAKEKNEVIKDYREFLRRAMKFIRALNWYIVDVGCCQNDQINTYTKIVRKEQIPSIQKDEIIQTIPFLFFFSNPRNTVIRDDEVTLSVEVPIKWK